MSTAFKDIVEKFLIKIEKDRDFFVYYNVDQNEAMKLALEQSKNYLIEAVDKLMGECVPDVDFYDYDLRNEKFHFDLTSKEQGLLSDLMREVYFERDFSLLKAFKIHLTPSDLNQFSPASERKTFIDMVKEIKNENKVKISRYASIDRISGKPKIINYSSYPDD